MLSCGSPGSLSRASSAMPSSSAISDDISRRPARFNRRSEMVRRLLSNGESLRNPLIIFLANSSSYDCGAISWVMRGSAKLPAQPESIPTTGTLVSAWYHSATRTTGESFRSVRTKQRSDRKCLSSQVNGAAVSPSRKYSGRWTNLCTIAARGRGCCVSAGLTLSASSKVLRADEGRRFVRGVSVSSSESCIGRSGWSPHTASTRSKMTSFLVTNCSRRQTVSSGFSLPPSINSHRASSQSGTEPEVPGFREILNLPWYPSSAKATLNTWRVSSRRPSLAWFKETSAGRRCMRAISLLRVMSEICGIPLPSTSIQDDMVGL